MSRLALRSLAEDDFREHVANFFDMHRPFRRRPHRAAHRPRFIASPHARLSDFAFTPFHALRHLAHDGADRVDDTAAPA